jgi:hypothetical protein
VTVLCARTAAGRTPTIATLSSATAIDFILATVSSVQRRTTAEPQLCRRCDLVHFMHNSRHLKSAQDG